MAPARERPRCTHLFDARSFPCKRSASSPSGPSGIIAVSIGFPFLVMEPPLFVGILLVADTSRPFGAPLSPRTHSAASTCADSTLPPPPSPPSSSTTRAAYLLLDDLDGMAPPLRLSSSQ